MRITPYLRRKIDPETPVEVYRNIRRGDYSIRQRGYVVGRANEVVLKEASFVVQAAGRKEVLRTGRKNVHAWVRGFVLRPLVKGLIRRVALHDGRPVRSARYNPRETKTFVDLDSGQPVRTASFVMLSPSGVRYV